MESRKEIVKQGLQTAFEGAEQKRNEDGKGENALPGKGLGTGAMLGDEIGLVKGFGEIGENCGMDSAKRSSLFYPLISKCYNKYYIMKSLT